MLPAKEEETDVFKRGLLKPFGKNVGALFMGGDGDNFYVTILNVIAKEVIFDTDVFRTRTKTWAVSKS